MADQADPNTPVTEPPRAETLLPQDDSGGEDGRFAVAEEVNLDQQSDAARDIGNLPEDQADAAKAVADTLAPEQAGQTPGPGNTS